MLVKMKSDYHKGTFQITNGVHHNITNNHRSHPIDHHHHLTSVTVIQSSTSSNKTSIVSAVKKQPSSGSSGKVSGSNCNQVNGSNSMSVYDDPRITHKVNLAAAFHDHISCTKLPSQISKNGGDINSLIGASLNNGSCLDTSNSLFGAAAASSNEDKIQIQKLKDMILMQLDLIQHQQEQLLKKDRQLQGLKHDREALCLRLEKLENRISFLTTKLLETSTGEISSSNVCVKQETVRIELTNHNSDSEMGIICVGDSNEASNVLTNVYSSSSPSSMSNPAIAPLSPQTGSFKVKSADQSPQLTSGTEIVSSGENDDTNDGAQPELIMLEDGNSDEQIETDQDNNSEEKDERLKEESKSLENKASHKRKKTNKTTGRQPTNNESSKSSSDKRVNEESSNEEVPSSCKKVKRRRTVSKGAKKTCDEPSEPVNNTDTKQISTNLVTVLETDEPYDLYNCRQEVNLPENDEKLLYDKPIKINQIEVPSWRINQIPFSTSTEGIESLDDDVFLKRHAKLEIDERRRKRWDIQRLREQKHNEKLRSGRYYNNTSVLDKPTITSNSKKRSVIDLVSFFPDPKEVQYIEVSNKIPVMAFGLPIPHLPPKPFALPWFKSSCQSSKS